MRPLRGLSVLIANGAGHVPIDPSVNSPILVALHDLHRALADLEIEYAIVGGLGVVRIGAQRTTGDIDVLVDRIEWERFRSAAESVGPAATAEQFRVGADWAEHCGTGMPVDALFAGDDWDLPFLLPKPGDIRVWDVSFGAFFLKPDQMLQLKAAVYLSKQREFGPATAAKDLADVTAILEAQPDLGSEAAVHDMPPDVQQVIRSAVREIDRRR
jgi:hypothetical protein